MTDKFLNRLPDNCFAGYRKGKSNNTVSFASDPSLSVNNGLVFTEKAGFIISIEPSSLNASKKANAND